MNLLLSFIPVPLTTASTLRVDGELSARDLSYVIAVSHLSTKTDPDDEGRYRIPDNALRADLGRTRRDSIEVEEARFRRLGAATITVDGQASPAPTLRTIERGQHSYPDRNPWLGSLAWVVNDALKASFSVTDGTNTVGLPISLLQHAECRYTLPMALRLLSWIAGAGNKLWMRGQGDGELELRMTLADFVSVLNLPTTMRPHRVLTDVVGPVVDEINAHTDMHLEIAPRIVQTKLSPRGRIRDLEIYVSYPAQPSVERIAKPASVKVGWQTPPKSKKPAAPAPTMTNVVPFSATVLQRPAKPMTTTKEDPDLGF